MSRKSTYGITVKVVHKDKEIAAASLNPTTVKSDLCTVKLLWQVMLKHYGKELENLSMLTWKAKKAGRNIQGDFTDAEGSTLMIGDRLTVEVEPIS